MPACQPQTPTMLPTGPTTATVATTEPIVPRLMSDHCSPTMIAKARNAMVTMGSVKATSGRMTGASMLSVPRTGDDRGRDGDAVGASNPSKDVDPGDGHGADRDGDERSEVTDQAPEHAVEW